MARTTTTLHSFWHGRNTLNIVVVGVLCMATLGIWVARHSSAPDTTLVSVQLGATAPLAVPSAGGPSIARPAPTPLVDSATPGELVDLIRQPTLSQTALFREMLANRDLSVGRLTVNELEQLGIMVCFFATVADDQTDYAANRDQVIADHATDSPLTPQQLAVVMDSAVRAFCADQTERLGLAA